jgi:hypothetical protein
MGSSRMSLPSPGEFRVGRFTILIEAAQLEVSSARQWLGTWHIYQRPRSEGDLPLRYGDTDTTESPDLAVGMARAIAKLVARSL